MSVRVPVKPELISWALNQADADLDTWQQGQMVEGWIGGSSLPTLKQLQDFAKKVHVPFGYLMLSAPPVLEKPLPDFRRRTVGSQRYSQELTGEIYAQQRKQSWFRDYAIDRGLDAVTWVKSASLSDNPVAVAQRLREEWGFSTASRAQEYADSRKQVFTFLEDKGVLMSIAGYFGSTKRSFDSSEFSGFSLCDDYAPLIFVNGKEAHSAQIFTMIHEVGHLVLGESAVSDDAANAETTHRSERWCDEFAAAFLMPSDEIRASAPSSLSENTVMPIAKRFKVSALALLNRLRDLKLISFEQWSDVYPKFEERAFEVLQKRAAEKSPGGNFYKVHTFIVGRRFAQAVYRDTLSGRTSYPEAHKLVGLPNVKTFNNFAQEVGA